MKTLPLLLSLCLPFIILAQDDYCICMEADNNYEDFFEVITDFSDQTVSWNPQDRSYDNNPVLGQDLSKPLVLLSEKDLPNDSVEEEEMDSSTFDRPSDSSRIKKKQKFYFHKIKRSKRFRKYKGKCPFF